MYISHSQKSRWDSCKRKWYLHYKQKLRSPRLSSALFFGNALDEAFGVLLLTKKRTKTEAELAQLQISAEDTFHNFMLKARNDLGEYVDVPQSTQVDYFGSDFDPDLLTEQHVTLIQKAAEELALSCPDLPSIEAFHEDVKKQLNWRNKDRRKLEENEIKLYNYITWLSLCEKGLLMVEAYKQEILPTIDEVYDIQKTISIKNEAGDEIGGKIDFTASFHSAAGTYVMDNKSSSTAYTEADLNESEQLGLYGFAEKNENVGYAVVQKKVFKKSPKIRTQLLLGKVAEDVVDKTLDNFADTIDTIVSAGEDIENYPQNWDSCFEYGRSCPYFRLCKHEKLEGLVQKQDSPKIGEKE